jgi:hypothetical protein
MKINSQGYGRLLGIGSRNPENKVAPLPNTSKRLEVSVSQDGMNKSINVELLVPIQRSKAGSRRVASLQLNGSQARSLYETLDRFFSEFNKNA